MAPLPSPGYAYAIEPLITLQNAQVVPPKKGGAENISKVIP